MLNHLVNLFFGTQFSDLCYRYNDFWRYCLKYFDVDCDGFEVETLLNIRMHLACLKITKVPSVEYQRTHGTSNLNALRDEWRILNLIYQERKRMPQQAIPVIQRQTISEEALP